jgi:acyl-CoA reductase-like NAD-dependent aldehyde dehydrogenase
MRSAQVAWGRAPIRRRLRVVKNVRHALAERADELARAVGRLDRRAPADTLGSEVLPLAEACRFLERNAERILGPRRLRPRPAPPPVGSTSLEIRREAFGVVLVIGPSNFPLLLPGVQAIQALAAGNAVLVKPGRDSRRPAELLGRILEEAGLPEDLYVVLGEGVAAATDAIEAGVDRVVLTGSADTGRAVLEQLAPRLVPATMELSGCDAMFVLPDADLELVEGALAFGLRLNGGATCIAPRRILVWRGVDSDLEDRLAHAVACLPDVPVEAPVAELARELIEDALDGGARVLAGGPPEGERMQPLLLAARSPDVELMRSDVFAPVACLVRVADEEEALRVDGLCPYALGASIFGGRRRALQLARRVNAGAVTVNDVIAPTADSRVPFGGRDRSGYGVTRGAEGLLEMTRVKAITATRPGWRPHYAESDRATEHLIRSLLLMRHGGSLRKRLAAFLRHLPAALQRFIHRNDEEAEGES